MVRWPGRRNIKESEERWWRTAFACAAAFLWLLVKSNGAIAQSNSSDSSLELEDFDFWAEQCQMLAQNRQYEEALAACEQAIALNDDIDETLEEWSTRGAVLVYLGRYEDALVSFDRVLEEQPDYSLVMTFQCMAQYNLGRFEEAVDTCEAALLTDGNWGQRSPASAWYYRGLSLQQMGFLETALESFERAVRLGSSNLAEGESGPDPTDGDQEVANPQPGPVVNPPNTVEEPLAQAEWCHTLHLLGQGRDDLVSPSWELCGLDEAIALYEQALLADPQDSVLWRQQGFALEQRGAYERALEAYNQALVLIPDHAQTLARQCGVLNQLERYEAALVACEAALQTVQSRDAHGMAYRLNQHSVALLGLERYEEALAAAERAIAILPDYGPAHNSKAVGLWRIDQNFAANQTIQTALQLYAGREEQFEDTFYRPNSDPWPLFYRDYGLAWFNYGRILASQGIQDLEGAAYAYIQSLQCPVQKFVQHSQNPTNLPEAPSACLNEPNERPVSQGEFAANLWQVSAIDEEFVVIVMDPVVRLQTQPVLPLDRYANTLLNLAAVYTDRRLPNRHQVAFTFASMTVQLDPESFVAWHNLGLAGLRSGNLEDAYYAYSIAHRIEPENLQVLMGVGEVLALQGRSEEAIAVYEQVLNLDPTYTPAQLRLDALVGQS